MRENTRAEKCRLIVFGILVAALILQGLPLGLVTYTEFALGEATSRIVNTYSYFNIQENSPLFLHTVAYLGCYPRGSSANPIEPLKKKSPKSIG